jgi:hypothetical protein
LKVAMRRRENCADVAAVAAACACAGGHALAAAAEQLESLQAAEGVDVDMEDGAARRVALATEVAAQWHHALEPQELPLHIRHLFA